MIDLKSATRGLTDKEIRDYVNRATIKYFEVTLKPNETTKEEVKTKRYNQNLEA